MAIPASKINELKQRFKEMGVVKEVREGGVTPTGFAVVTNEQGVEFSNIHRDYADNPDYGFEVLEVYPEEEDGELQTVAIVELYDK